MKYVALLRGINVGGNNKVPMAELRAAMEQAGFASVSTYINSGNIFFADTTSTKPQLTDKLEQLIEATFGFYVKVLVKSQADIETINAAIPEHYSNDKDMKCDVMFLWEHFDSEAVLKDLPIRDGIDEPTYVAGAIIWAVRRNDAGKSGLLKLVGTDLYKHMTIRNCNTTRKLQLLMRDSL